MNARNLFREPVRTVQSPRQTVPDPRPPSVFVYDTLMLDEELAEALGTSRYSTMPAKLKGWQRRRQINSDEAAIVPEEGHCVEGKYVSGFSADCLQRMDRRYRQVYQRASVTVLLKESKSTQTLDETVSSRSLRMLQFRKRRLGTGDHTHSSLGSDISLPSTRDSGAPKKQDMATQTDRPPLTKQFAEMLNGFRHKHLFNVDKIGHPQWEEETQQVETLTYVWAMNVGFLREEDFDLDEARKTSEQNRKARRVMKKSRRLSQYMTTLEENEELGGEELEPESDRIHETGRAAKLRTQLKQFMRTF